MDLDKDEDRAKIHIQRQQNKVIKEIYRICAQLNLDFRDFKGAFMATGYYGEEKSLERILNNGLPEKYFRNLRIFNGLAKAVDTAFHSCIDGTYKLKYSKIEAVKKGYESMNFQGSFQARLYQLAVFAKRADPEYSKREAEAIRIFMQETAAKSFFDAMEQGMYEEFKGKYGNYYKIKKAVCWALYDMLTQDPVIMKRLQKKFDRKDYFPVD